ncbi:MAG: ribose 5-phosphate isomerase B [Lachnospiraceae bacterium]|nr:ribose 5-phosphate isomerase B [Lachnospiraceae bacterium]
MKISIGSDHGAYDLKQYLIEHLTKRGFEVSDKGCDSKASCDYPVYAKAVAEDVAKGNADRGIVLCTTGIGVSITANKVKGIRCALCHNEHTALMTRLHNDSNVLAMGAAELTPVLAERIADIWLDTEFSGEEKHARRIAGISAVEEEN